MNNTNHSYCRYWIDDDQTLKRTSKIMAIILVGGFALFGNILIILLATRYTVRKNINYMIINMAVSDMLVVVMFSSLRIRESANNLNYPFIDVNDQNIADIICKMTKFLEMSAKLVTLINLLILSAERFRATRVGVPRACPRARARYLCPVITSWVLPMLLASYNLYFWQSWYFEFLKTSMCRINHDDIDVVLPCYTFVTLVFVLALLTIALLSVLTLRSLSSSRVIAVDLSDVHKQLRNKRMACAARMVLCSLLLYGFCYIPTFSMDVVVILWNYRVADLSTICIDWRSLMFMLDFLLIVNSCLSPCVYIIFLKDFRKAAIGLFIDRNVNRHGTVKRPSNTTLVDRTVFTTTKL